MLVVSIECANVVVCVKRRVCHLERLLRLARSTQALCETTALRGYVREKSKRCVRDRSKRCVQTHKLMFQSSPIPVSVPVLPSLSTYLDYDPPLQEVADVVREDVHQARQVQSVGFGAGTHLKNDSTGRGQRVEKEQCRSGLGSGRVQYSKAE